MGEQLSINVHQKEILLAKFLYFSFFIVLLNSIIAIPSLLLVTSSQQIQPTYCHCVSSSRILLGLTACLRPRPRPGRGGIHHTTKNFGGEMKARDETYARFLEKFLLKL